MTYHARSPPGRSAPQRRQHKTRCSRCNLSAELGPTWRKNMQKTWMSSHGIISQSWDGPCKNKENKKEQTQRRDQRFQTTSGLGSLLSHVPGTTCTPWISQEHCWNRATGSRALKVHLHTSIHPSDPEHLQVWVHLLTPWIPRVFQRFHHRHAPKKKAIIIIIIVVVVVVVVIVVVVIIIIITIIITITITITITIIIIIIIIWYPPVINAYNINQDSGAWVLILEGFWVFKWVCNGVRSASPTVSTQVLPGNPGNPEPGRTWEGLGGDSWDWGFLMRDWESCKS